MASERERSVGPNKTANRIVRRGKASANRELRRSDGSLGTCRMGLPEGGLFGIEQATRRCARGIFQVFLNVCCACCLLRSPIFRACPELPNTCMVFEIEDVLDSARVKLQGIAEAFSCDPDR